ncbi:AAA family ATPase [Methanoplanus limicola]|uniref:ORC1/DEAH AAA+ ATPase domain-containing protein n=1 Tax=Methanoplanus limicola DSM 2279 TaxID=937775 RepID=H1Z1K1_9EURY|nr:AAA family ATPase [Methanoplanus limicola]EHQ34527.1 hypothetical protein Metlim_0386 [Methanoplanus limicola DSM 2279]
MRFFNTAGPVRCSEHYCLPPLSRFDLPEILSLIDQKKYFILHAPRQSGKTSCLLALRELLNHEGRYSALYINIEMAQTARNDVSRGMKAILSELAFQNERTLGDSALCKNISRSIEDYGEDAALNVVLSELCRRLKRPLVLCIDEVDALVGDTLISLLRQIRSGYPSRSESFPVSVILCGVRDVRDYRIHSGKEKEIITGGSAFNIKAESLRIGNFSEEETKSLLFQHTEETGQVFEEDALNEIWRLTCGQPWLVNALAYEVCFKLKEGKDRENPITKALVTEAKENLIRRRETHLDQLVDKLKEERVRRVIEPMLTGEIFEQSFRTDDIDYLVDLGLITQAENGAISISNPIYQEIIPRELSWEAQSGMALNTEWYIAPDGKLQLYKLLKAFQQFFREHSESWTDIAQYKEAGPQLLLQAFLQRIVNGGGEITREYGLGMGRTDLFILWQLPNGESQRFVIECKIRHRSREATIQRGTEQVVKYADRCGAEEIYLIVFDRSKKKNWDDKIFTEDLTCEEKEVTVLGM